MGDTFWFSLRHTMVLDVAPGSAENVQRRVRETHDRTIGIYDLSGRPRRRMTEMERLGKNSPLTEPVQQVPTCPHLQAASVSASAGRGAARSCLSV